MKPVTLQQICDWSRGSLANGDPATVVRSVSTDTRTAGQAALFVALSGEKYDAHNFLAQAFERGAAAAVVSRKLAPTAGPLIEVEDTLAALQRLAASYRQTLSPFVAVAVTGSNGKTSTKDLLTSVLSTRFKVNATKGNLNNHIGLPLTVLNTEPDHTAGVWEIGMNHAGEIAPLAEIARPDVAVITNIGTAHIEFFGSRRAIAQEKGVLAEAVAEGGCVVLNADDDMSADLARRCRARVLTAGFSGGDVRAERVDGTSFDLALSAAAHDRNSRVRIKLPVPGAHMISNALLAAAVGVFLGLSLAEIRTGLETARLHGGRLERKCAAGLDFIDDSYNANPDSMKAALATLVALPCSGRRWAVLGRMGELGAHSREGHRLVGRSAREQGVDFLLTVGEDDSRLINDAFDDPGRSRHFPTHLQAARFLEKEASSEDVILLKGSRTAAMEKILDLLAASEASPAIH